MGPDSNDPLIDIIVATVGRTDELRRLVESIGAQTYRPVRLIVVDQNEDERVAQILERLPEELPTLRLRSARGLSRARNVGLKAVEGEFVAFADDDCWYGPDLLERVTTFLQEHPDYGGITTRLSDETGAPSTGHWHRSPGPLNRSNVFFRATSCTMFLRRAVIEEVGAFDEDLGIGAETDFLSGEETDYLLRALASGFEVWYDPSLCVFHPTRRLRHDRESVRAARRFGMGLGRVLRKHAYPWWYAAYQAGGAIWGAVVGIARGRPFDARFQLSVARGRIAGWRAPYNPAAPDM
jgi:GT2 family glycosyltransferase